MHSINHTNLFDKKKSVKRNFFFPFYFCLNQNRNQHTNRSNKFTVRATKYEKKKQQKKKFPYLLAPKDNNTESNTL